MLIHNATCLGSNPLLVSSRCVDGTGRDPGGGCDRIVPLVLSRCANLSPKAWIRHASLELELNRKGAILWAFVSGRGESFCKIQDRNPARPSVPPKVVVCSILVVAGVVESNRRVSNL